MSRVETIVDATVEENARDPPLPPFPIDATNEDLSRVETIVDATVDENAREPPFSIDATNEDLSRVETIDATSLLDTTDATIEDLSRRRNCKAVRMCFPLLEFNRWSEIDLIANLLCLQELILANTVLTRRLGGHGISFVTLANA